MCQLLNCIFLLLINLEELWKTEEAATELLSRAGFSRKTFGLCQKFPIQPFSFFFEV